MKWCVVRLQGRVEFVGSRPCCTDRPRRHRASNSVTLVIICGSAVVDGVSYLLPADAAASCVECGESVWRACPGGRRDVPRVLSPPFPGLPLQLTRLLVRSFSSVTAGKTITCKAAVAFAAKEPLKIVDVQVAPPQKGAPSQASRVFVAFAPIHALVGGGGSSSSGELSLWVCFHWFRDRSRRCARVAVVLSHPVQARSV